MFRPIAVGMLDGPRVGQRITEEDEIEMSSETNRKPRGRWARRVAIVAATAAVVAPATVWAANIPDVPASNVHHDNINWAFNNGVTAGCGGGNYCPEGNVTRAQMASFMRNLAGYVASAGVHVENLNTGPTITASFNNVNDTAPTVALAGIGILEVDLGFDLGDKIVQCTAARRTDTALHVDRTCTVRVDGSTALVSNRDLGSANQVEGDFYLTVSG